MKLTEAQKRVMKLVTEGRKVYATESGIKFNGEKIATVKALIPLINAGLVQRDGLIYWKATAAGLGWRDAPPADQRPSDAL